MAKRFVMREYKPKPLDEYESHIGLPSELLWKIFALCDLRSLWKVRAVCKYLRDHITYNCRGKMGLFVPLVTEKFHKEFFSPEFHFFRYYPIENKYNFKEVNERKIIYLESNNVCLSLGKYAFRRGNWEMKRRAKEARS